MIIENQEIKCLDHGFVRLVDHMGDDQAIVDAARVSYQRGTKHISKDQGLINYLMRHHHMTPFEMVEFKFHVKLPIFIARQWIRHRTANVNEMSARYSQLDKEFYIPDANQVRLQSLVNKQGGNEVADDQTVANFRSNLDKDCEQSYALYEQALNHDVAREIARMHLQPNIYTQWYWKIDLRNLFGFLLLRRDSHAQYEIRVFADAMFELIKPYVPMAVHAWEEYQFYAHTFSRTEMEILRADTTIIEATPNSDGLFETLSKRERIAFNKALNLGDNNE